MVVVCNCTYGTAFASWQVMQVAAHLKDINAAQMGL